jgi:putative FmdB family regulatory protein
MIYLYCCPKCTGEFDVWKPAKDMDAPEECANCKVEAKRVICAPRGFINAGVENAEFNAGLGCVTKNRQHRAEICKRRGLEEIGNEKPDTIHKAADDALASKLSWENV